jgi:hypothetical protein
MYKAWQIASCNHSRILTASLVRSVVRDLIMQVRLRSIHYRPQGFDSRLPIAVSFTR